MQRAIIRARSNEGGIRTERSLQSDATSVAMTRKCAKGLTLVSVIHRDRCVDVSINEQKVLAVRGKLEAGWHSIGGVVERKFKKWAFFVLSCIIQFDHSGQAGSIVGDTENESFGIISDEGGTHGLYFAQSALHSNIPGADPSVFSSRKEGGGHGRSGESGDWSVMA